MHGNPMRDPSSQMSRPLTVLLIGAAVLLAACSSSTRQQAADTSLAPADAQPGAATVVAAATTVGTPTVQKLLKVNPVSGPVGTRFSITGSDLPPSRALDLVWLTADGSFVMKAGPENVEFHEKAFVEKTLPLGRAQTDASGVLSASFEAPEDYGEVHDIFAMIDGEKVARGGFRLMRQVSISPTSGAIGTPITIKVSGLGSKTYESTIAVRYDNQFTGIVSAVTTRGTAVFELRAAGRTGKHVIDINHGGKSVPYLNNQQSGTAHIPDWRFEFHVTSDTAMPSAAIDWPEAARVTAVGDSAPTAATGTVVKIPGFKASLISSSGPILSQTTLKASGLPPQSSVELFWITARGNRVSPSGWSLTETPLTSATADATGSITAGFQVPDDLGGWHVIKVVQGGKVWAEVPYFVERSLVGVSPLRVKAGETFTVQMKGVGWTELDNGVAVTYDNAYIGFGCGFNSNGDVTMELVATGGPGIHLIDLYPMIYQGHGKPPWGYQVPLLTFKQDAPGLTLGYKLPALRLAILIEE